MFGWTVDDVVEGVLNVLGLCLGLGVIWGLTMAAQLVPEAWSWVVGLVPELPTVIVLEYR